MSTLIRNRAASLLMLSIISCLTVVIAGGSTTRRPIAVRAAALPTEQPGQTASITYAVIGDYGSAGEAEAEVAALVHTWQPEFIITTGDNNYDLGDASTIDRNIGQYYGDFIAPYTGKYGPGAFTNRFFPALGNHDWSTESALPYLDYFSLPGNERYYDFVRGPVHFFALDSDEHEPDGVSAASKQANWLRERLIASTSPWNVVYFHHPPYSSGDHGNNAVMQWPFKAWGASVVMSGHDHDYERISQDGLAYFVNGLGGRTPYGFHTPVAGSRVRYNAEFGAMLVQGTAERMTYRFINSKNVQVDRYEECKRWEWQPGNLGCSVALWGGRSR